MAHRPLTDTSPAAQRLMDELYRAMTPAQKLDRVRELTLLANHLALEGVRLRHPDESEQGLLLRLVRIRLGDELVERAYPESVTARGT